LGWLLSKKDDGSIELNTWKDSWLLGIPDRKSFETTQAEIRGFV
jgi:hypothetical protein